MDIVERLRNDSKADVDVYDLMNDAADEIARLRRRLQDGSPIHEAVVQHMAMEIAGLKKELAIADEANRLLNNHLRLAEERLAECERERNDAIRASMNDMKQLATVTAERDELAQSQKICRMCEAKIKEAALAKLGADKTGEK